MVGPFGVLETKWFLMGVFSISMLWLRSSSSKLGLGFQLSGESIVLLKIVEVTWAKVVVISDHAKHVVDCYKTTIHVCVMLYWGILNILGIYINKGSIIRKKETEYKKCVI